MHNILLVDDNREQILVMQKILAEQGFKTLTAFDGKSALDLAKNESPSLILLDISLPDISGFDVLDKLNQDSNLASIPVIVVTGVNKDEVDQQKALEKGALEYIIRPFHANELVDRVNSALHVKDIEAKLRESEELYRLTLTNITDAVFITNDDDQFVFICGNVKFLFGIHDDEMMRKKYASKFLDKNLFDRSELDRKGEIPNIHTRVKDTHGNNHDVLVNVKKVSIREGTILYSIRDITDLRKTEKQLFHAKSELELKNRIAEVFLSSKEDTVFNAIVGTIANIFNADFGLICYSSEGMFLIPYIGKNLSSDPEEIAVSSIALKNLQPNSWVRELKKGRPFKNNKSDLSQVSEESYAMDIAVPILFQSEVIGALFLARKKKAFTNKEMKYFTEIAELISPQLRLQINRFEEYKARKEAEKALRTSEAKFRAYIEESPLGIFVSDFDGNYIDVNKKACEMTCFSRDEILKMNIAAMTYPDDMESSKESFEKLRTKGLLFTEIRLNKKDGGFVEISLQAAYIGNQQLIAFCQDITEKKAIERKARINEERYRSTIAGMLDGFFLLKALHNDAGILYDFEFVEANEKGARIVSMSREELLGKKLCETFPINKESGFFDKYKHVFESGESLEEEFYIPVGQIGSGWYFHQVVPHSDGVAITNKDITERKRAENDLKESVERFRSLVSYADEAIVLTDLDGTILFYNIAGMTMWSAKDSEQYLGQNLFRRIYENSRPLKKQTILRKIEKEVIKNKEYDFEIEGGDHIPIELTLSPIRDLSDNPISLIIMMRDISERKTIEEDLKAYRERLEELVEERTLELQKINTQLIEEIDKRKNTESALRKSEENYKLLIENANVGIAVIAKDSFKFVNTALTKITGYSESELMEQIPFDTVHPDQVLRARNIYDEVISGKNQQQEIEIKISSKKNESRWVELSLLAIQWEGAEAILAFVNDATKRKLAQKEAEKQREQLIQADKMASLGTLVSGVAHEINNPNNFILLGIQALTEMWLEAKQILDDYYQENKDLTLGGFEYSEMKERVNSLNDGIFDSAMRIKELVRSLKDFARQDNSDLSQPVLVNDVIKSAVTLIENKIRKSTSNFSMILDYSVPLIKGNRNRLEQVVINLIQNACDAIEREDAAVTIKSYVQERTGNVVIEVEDEGKGIPESLLKNIYDPFFTTKRDSGGTGLGLSVSDGIVKSHKGKFDIQSEFGQGTIAKIILPTDGQKQSEGE